MENEVVMHPMDVAERDEALFPVGKVDEHGEPLDLRKSTSWNQKIDEISTVELVEVQIVNSTVPFMFISSFTPLLEALSFLLASLYFIYFIPAQYHFCLFFYSCC